MIIRVVACVIEDEGKLLVCQRPLSKRHGGLWEFPGGKLEEGESDEDAVRRELAEELELSLTGMSDSQFTIADPGSQFVIAFIPVRVSGDPVPHEHMAIQWKNAHDLIQLPLAPSDRAFVEHLLNNHDA